MAEEAILSLNEEQLRFALYCAIALLGAGGAFVIRFAIGHIGDMGKRLKRVEFWLSKQFGFDPDE